MSGLRLVHAKEAPCWPWELRSCGKQPAKAAYCHLCRREVALPVEADGERPTCIYCALDTGLVEAVDEPLSDYG